MEEVRHKHYQYIVAWAKGVSIQKKVNCIRYSNITKVDYTWIDEPNPSWHEDEVYRFKPVYKTQEVIIGFVYDQFFINAVQCDGNYLVTYNAIDGEIIDISKVNQ